MGHAVRNCPDRAPRFPLTVPVHFRKSGMSHWLEGHSINMSRTGILVNTDGEIIPPPSLLDIRVNFPRDLVIECQGSVVRLDGSAFAVRIHNCHLLHQP